MAAGGIVLWTGADRQPSVPTQPIVVHGSTKPAPANRRTLRIGTFNIHGGRGRIERAVDLAATADVLRRSELDLIGLNEVHGSFGSDQARELAERLGTAALFVGTERRWWHDHFGNALLTRRPLENTLRIPLPCTQGKKYRNTVLTTVHVAGRPVKILATHTDTAVDRDEQLAAVFGLFRSLEAPAVLIGDLNSTADHPPVAALLAEPDATDAVAAKLGPASQVSRIDHIIVRGLDVRDAGIVETTASDHPHVWAELALP